MERRATYNALSCFEQVLPGRDAAATEAERAHYRRSVRPTQARDRRDPHWARQIPLEASRREVVNVVE